MAVDKYTLAYLKRKEELEKIPPQQSMLSRAESLNVVRTLPGGSGDRVRLKLKENIGGPSALERRDAERAAALLPTGLEAAGMRPTPLLTQPAQVSPQELKGELMNRQHQGIYTMPGSVEETIANLEKRRDGLRQALEQARRQSEMDLVLNPTTGKGERGAEVRRISDALAEAENTLWETKRARERAGLEAVTGAADFLETARRGRSGDYQSAMSGLLPTMDRLLRVAPAGEEIAGIVASGREWENQKLQPGAAALEGDPRENLNYLTPEEKNVILYYAGKGAFDKVSEYYQSLTRELNARRQGEESAQAQDMARKHPFLGSAANISASYLSPMSYAANLGQTVKNAGSGEYEPTDENAPAFRYAHMVDDTAAGVSKAAEKMPLFGGMEVKGKNLGSFLAETGLSIGQFLSKVPLGGAGALGYIGAGAAGQGTLNTLERGGTPGQALALGTANGLIEVATEKIGLDNLLSIARRAGGNGVVHALLDIGGQALIEGSEEAISEVANNIADLAVTGDKAELNQYVGQLMEQGMSREEAESAALKQFFLVNTAWAAAGGAVSGGVMGAGGVAVSALRGAQETRTNRAIDSAYGAMLENGMFSPEARSAQARANQRLGWLPTGRQGMMLDGRLPTGAEALGMEEAQQNSGQLNIVDSTNPENYNGEKGGVPDGREAYAAGGQETDPGRGVPGLQERLGTASERRGHGRGDSGFSGFIRLSDQSRAKLADNGVVNIDLEDRSADGAVFTSALAEARKADGKNGWAVTLKTPDELVGDKVLLSKDGTNGMAITPDGDIVAVFNNKKAGGPKKATAYLIPTAIANGGVKLDCYGERLVRLYARYGFVPVARVAFNPEFANDGWTPEKGTPDIYFMIHTGDSADAVVEKMDTYRQFSLQELEALPLMSYDEAAAYRDELLLQMGRGAGPEDSVGAAEAGFAGDYNRLQNQTGAKDFHPDGERAYRQVDVPKRDFEGRNISKSPATVMEAQAIPDAAIGEIQQMIANGKFSYDRNTDRGAMQRAERTIQEIGFDGAMERFHQAAREGKVGKDLMSLGATLLNNAANSRDAKAMAQILSDYVSMSRAGAQATQANRLLKQMSPQWQLAAIERSVENIQSNLDRKYGEKAPSVQMDPALIEAYMNALNQPGRDKVAKQIYADVADQLPSTFADKWNAWRYVAMLTNPRTHVRNLVGNAGFAPVRALKNMIGVGLEVAVQKTAGLEGRTKTVLGPGDIGLVKQAWADFGQVQDEAMGAGKWSEASGTVQQERTIFKNNGAWGTGENSHALARGARTAADGLMTGLEWVRRTNSKLMEAEDSIFLRSAYTTSLAGYLKANGVTDMASADPRLLDQARSYAVLEAQKATYRDSNAFSDWVAQLGRDTGGPAAKAGHFLMEGVLPFKRTPANILVRGMEYSPAGLVKGLSYDLYKVRKGRMTGTEAIDHIASGLTGTALLGLGMFLAASGAVTGGGDDDKKKAAMDDLTGGQNYALNVGNKSYTLDWMAPEALPFFMGVELFGQMQKRKGGGLTVKSALAAAERIADPMLEMSMLQGLQDIIDSVKYSDGNAFLGVLAGAAVNHLTQAVPTLFGQIERTTEEQRTSTYVDNASGLPNDLQYTLGKVFNKLPGEFQQIPYIDAWGRTHSNGGLLPRAGNNFLNPSFVSEKNITELDREALRLYEQLGDGGVLPDRAGKYVTVSGRRHDLSAEQYVKYATRRGQGAYSTAEAVVSSGLYQGLTEGQKAAAVQAAYSYADAVAKESLGLGYEPDKWVDKARLMNDEGRAAFLVARVLLADGETSGEKRDILRRADMPEEQKIQAYRMLLSDTKDEDIEAVLNTGLSFNDFLEAQNKQNEINNTMTKATAAERATEFAHWAHGEGYTEKQAAAVREAFGFYSFVPQDELRYDKLLGAGFPEDKAYELTGALADVGSIRGDKDANGKTVSLSASQKKKAAIDAATPGLSQQERRILYEMFDVSQKVW